MITTMTPTTGSARRRLPAALVLAAAALLAPAFHAALYAQTVSGAGAGPALVLYAADEGLPGDGRPPSPGPTDPDGPTF